MTDGRPEDQGGTGAPAAAGAAGEPAGALAELERLKADGGFLARVRQGDQEARARWDRAHQAAYPNPSPDALAGGPGAASRQESPPVPPVDEARAELERLKADSAFLERVRQGDQDARAQWDQAHQAAYPDPESEVPRGEAPADGEASELEAFIANPITDREAWAAVNSPEVREAAAAIGMSQGLLAELPKLFAGRPGASFTREACVDEVLRLSDGDHARATAMIHNADKALFRVLEVAPDLERVFQHPALILNPKLIERLARYGETLEKRAAER